MDHDVISSDSHVIEPHDLWQDRVPAAYRPRAPRLVRDATTDRLVCDQADLPPVGLLAGCARRDTDVREDGRWEEDVFPGGYDPERRLADLAKDGVDAEVLFPTIAMQLYPIEEPGFRWALLRAYNTWLAEVMCAPYPDRFKGIAMLDLDDVDLAVAEVARAAGLGLGGVMVPLFAGENNPYHDERFDPLWTAVVDHGLPVNLHAATTRVRDSAWNTGTSTDKVLRTYQAQRVILDMIREGLFDRFPGLMVVSAENDAGWAGNLVERADYNWHRGRNLSDDWRCRREPSSYFRRNIRLTFMRDHTAVQARSVIGTETLMWGNDFPHHVSTWPHSAQVLAEHFAKVPDADRQAIVCGNVRALYGF